MEDDRKDSTQEVQPLRKVPAFEQVLSAESKECGRESIRKSGMCVQDVPKRNVLRKQAEKDRQPKSMLKPVG